MTNPDRLAAAYTYFENLPRYLDTRLPIDAEIHQAANDFNLHFLEVQRALPQLDVVKGTRELMETDHVVELLSRAASLRAVLEQHLYPTGSFVPSPFLYGDRYR